MLLISDFESCKYLNCDLFEIANDKPFKTNNCADSNIILKCNTYVSKIKWKLKSKKVILQVYLISLINKYTYKSFSWTVQ